MLGQQVLLDLGGAAQTDPAFLGVATAVQKIKNRELAVRIAVVIGGNVNRHVAKRFRLRRAVGPVLDGAVRNVLQLVEARRVAGDFEIAPEDGSARPHAGVRFVDGANAVHEERIAVNIRFERTDGERPKAARFLMHGHAPHAGLILDGACRLGVQRPNARRNRYFRGLRRTDAESDPVIGADPWGNQGLRTRPARCLRKPHGGHPGQRQN